MRRELTVSILIAALLLANSPDAALAAKRVKRAGGSGGGGALQQGIYNYNKGYIKKAIPLLQRAVQQSPNSEQAQLWLAKALKKQGGPANLQAAQNAFEQVIQINPDNVEALTALGEMLSWQPQTRGRAIELLQRADRNKPGEPAVVKVLAQSLYWEGRYAEALNLVEPLADRFQNDKGWMTTYASLLAKTGSPEKAVEIFENNLNAPTSKDYYLRQAYAVALFQAGRTDDARALFNTLTQEADTLPVDKQVALKLGLGGLAYDMGMFDEAIRIDRSLPSEALDARPEIQLRIARSLAKTQRIPEAVSQFQAVYQSGKMSPQEKLEYGDFLVNQDLPPESMPSPNTIEALYQDALNSLGEDQGQAHIRLARYYSNLEGRSEDAIRSFWAAIQNTGGNNQASYQKEFLDYLKSDRLPAESSDKAFRELLAQSPNNTSLKAAYAEYLSYQPPRRGESLQLYLSLVKENPDMQAELKEPIEKVLNWDKASQDKIPLYQEAVSLYPDSKEAQLILARAYNLNPNTRVEALKLYQQLVTSYPEDKKIKKEWASLLIGDESRRNESIRLLSQLYQENPQDLGIKIAYAKLLSYEHQYTKALRLFNEVLAEEPDNKDALVGRGYNYLIDGQRFTGLDQFESLKTQFPDDVEVTMGLAEAYRSIGRYDKALRLIRDVKPLLNWTPPVWDFAPETPQVQMIPAQFESSSFGSSFSRSPVADFSIMPYSTRQEVAPEKQWREQFQGKPAKPKSIPSENDAPQISDFETSEPPAPKHGFHFKAKEPQEMMHKEAVKEAVPYWENDLGSLPEKSPAPAVSTETVIPPNSSIQANQSVQANEPPQPSDGYIMLGTEEDLNPEQLKPENLNDVKAEGPQDPIQSDIQDMNAAIKSIKSIQNQANTQLNTIHRNLSNTEENDTEAISLNGKKPELEGEGEGGNRDVLKAWGQYAQIDQDTNPILSQVGRFKTESETLEKQIYKELRPMARTGWSYMTQDGEKTTVRMRGWTLPNQMSLSLTPQLRARTGFSGGKFYQPRVFTSPSSTGVQAYMLGGTAKYWDHVTLDGELSLLHFDQSETFNMTYNTQMTVDFNDQVHWKLGSRRFQNPNSFLSLNGYRPIRGPFQGDVVGQVMETTVFTEINLMPIRNWDVNMGYEWAFVSGERTPTNFRNQAFFSTGYTVPYARNHYARVGYEFLYFGYSKDATLGYFNLDSGTDQPVVKLDNRITRAPRDSVFGGYFSPEYFFLNNFRLDLRGSFMKKFVEYRLGASMGVQTFSFGERIFTETPTSIASTVDGNVILNFNDWLSGYMHGEMLKGGGAFNRFRFGGGLIIRPDIPALSPVFGKI